VPGSSAFARFAKLPPVDPKKVNDIVQFEAVQQIPFPIEEDIWDYHPIGGEEESGGHVVYDFVKQRKDDLEADALVIADSPAATAEKVRGDWMLTGDRGLWEDGLLRFVGREDDVITSAGYRIGPAEIEDCLLTHPDVATVGVVGKPDPLRTEIVKAYVVPKPGVEPSEDLAAELEEYVKKRLATYSYPREIAFLKALPMTVTGKVIRKELKALARSEAGE